MCGRYTQTRTPEEIQQLIAFDGDDHLLQPRYNVAPTQLAPVIDAQHALRSMRWGLVPFWAKDEKGGARMINARAETVSAKPAFKKLLERQRCLVPADGFYEWKKTGRARQPYYFRLRDAAPFAFAGLWDGWRSPDQQELHTFTILTTEANEILRPVHDRMPVMLNAAGCREWLDPTVTDPEMLRHLWQPFPADQMVSHPVSSMVNSPKIDQPDCIQPRPEPGETLELDFGK